ncbi:MAG: carboxypeptidase-like regulatory domain-containing protein [Blastocatellia bacterium]
MKSKLQFVLSPIMLLCLLLVFVMPLFVTDAAAQQAAPPAAPQAAAPKQQPQELPLPRRGTIKGRVLGDDGQPLAEVPVLASPIGRSAAARRPGPGGPAGAPSQTTTDEEGNFTFENLTPNSYSISATVPGYIAPPAEEETGAGIYHLGDMANITLVKGGVITGKIVNASGDILVGVSVSAIRTGNINGEEDENMVPQVTGPGQGFGRTWRTDDRGVYRIYGLVPGTYIVQAGPPGNGPGGFSPNFPSPYNGDAPTYYPSAVRDAAVPVAVQASGELSGIDIRYRGEKGHAVSGKVLAKADSNATGFANGLNATIISLSLPGTDNIVATAVQMNRGPGGGPGGRFGQASDGGFALYGVPDGEYEISARRNGFGMESDAVAAPRRVSVRGTDVGGLQLALLSLASLSGRVVMERKPGICPLPRRAFMEEVLLNTDRDEAIAHETALSGRVRPSAPLASGEFILRNLEAGRWRIAAQLPDENWYLRAITAETKPSATATRRTAMPAAALTLTNAARTGFMLKSGEKQAGLLVIIAEGAAAVKGKVVSESGKAVGKVRVHLLPAEKEADDDIVRYAEANTTGDGSFQFKNLAPGNYLLLSKPIKSQASQASGNATVRPIAWDNAQRAALRREAEAAGNRIELKTCQRFSDYKLKLK